MIDVVTEWVCGQEEMSNESGGPVGLHYLLDITRSGSEERQLQVKGMMEARTMKKMRKVGVLLEQGLLGHLELVVSSNM